MNGDKITAAMLLLYYLLSHRMRTEVGANLEPLNVEP
jgi:hypothetical protein